MDVQDEIEALKQRIAELEYHVKGEREFPQLDDEYWYIDDEGMVFNTKFENIKADRNSFKIGNVFRTEDEAKFQAEKLKAEAELRKFSRPFEYGRFNYFLFYDIDNDVIRTDLTTYCLPQGAIYFESGEKVEEAIETVGVGRIKKYIFGVED